jgi:hypothetical protein
MYDIHLKDDQPMRIETFPELHTEMCVQKSASPHSRPDLISSSDLEEKITHLREELRMDVINSIKVSFTEAVALLASKPPSPIALSQEFFQATNQQALHTQRVIESVKGQLGR